VTIVIRAEDEPVPTRLAYLRHAVRDTIAPFDLRVDAEPNFRSQIVTGAAGPLRLTTVAGPTLEAERSRRLVRQSDPGLFKIDVQTRGRSVFAQDDREAVLAPGDFTLVNLSRPCRLAALGDPDQEVVAVQFPRSLLPIGERELTSLTAVRIGGRDGLAGLVSSLVVHLRDGLDTHVPADLVRLSTALTDLLVVGLAGLVDRPSAVPPEGHRRALLWRVRAFIEECLGDPGLSPAVVAAANHVSVRYLHSLFESEEATVAGWIRWRRLERCRRDLLDPALQSWSVRAIGARWGLIDPQHFSRVFRATYGLPPAEYREAHREPAVSRSVGRSVGRSEKCAPADNDCALSDNPSGGGSPQS
jgi:AraC-like DNA-binding protein